MCAILEKVLFEIIDQLITALPDFLGHKLVHTHHKHILVVRAIEDNDLACLRRLLLDTPEEVMLCLLLRRCFESMNPRTLRVHRAQDVIDGSVFAGGIQCLQADEQGSLVLSVKKILQFPQLPVEFLNLPDR